MSRGDRTVRRGRLHACASGWQAATTTLVAFRSIVHALRGWPTPLGVCINTTAPAHEADEQLAILGEQVVTLGTVE